MFFQSHESTYPRLSRQYMSAIFYHNKEQEELAVEAKTKEAEKKQKKVHTEILPLETFYLAEDYHQKYYFQSNLYFLKHIPELFPEPRDLIESTLASRLNAYVRDFIPSSTIESILDKKNPAHEKLWQAIKALEEKFSQKRRSS